MTELEKAKWLLGILLADGATMTRMEIAQRAKERGVGKSTLKQARLDMGIKSKAPVIDGHPDEANRIWFLPHKK